MLRTNYIDRVLVRRVDLGLLGCLSFHSIVYSDHRFFWVHLKLDKPRISTAGYWKFNTSLFEEKDFWDQLLLTLMRQSTGSVFENKWWDHLKATIRSFVAELDKQNKRHKNPE